MRLQLLGLPTAVRMARAPSPLYKEEWESRGFPDSPRARSPRRFSPSTQGNGESLLLGALFIQNLHKLEPGMLRSLYGSNIPFSPSVKCQALHGRGETLSISRKFGKP